MLDMIWEGVKRVIRFFTGEREVAETSQPSIPGTLVEEMVVEDIELERPEAGILADDLANPPVTLTEGDPVDLSRWTVTEHVESPFEKVGRLYIEGDDLVVRSDLDHRGFRVVLADVDAVFDGEVKSVRLLGSGEEVGTVKVSVSGKGMNFSISPFFYTTPLQSVLRVLAGEVRKAPLFVGRDQVE